MPESTEAQNSEQQEVTESNTQADSAQYPSQQTYAPPRSPYALPGQGIPTQPHQPYPHQYPYYQTHPYAQPAKARVWPWVLAICLVLGFLGLGGCVGCIACASILSEEESSPHPYEYTYPYGYGYNYDYNSPESTLPDSSLDTSTYTLAEIETFAKDLPSTVKDGICSTGMFEVGSGKDIEAGLYYLEGSQSEEGEFLIFRKDASSDGYILLANVFYFGNYFADLSEGDVIVFLTPASKYMHLAKNTAYEVSDPLESGCYRVGIDIPAGTYQVTLQGIELDENTDAGVYVMKDLGWSEDSMLEYYYLIAGSSHTITVSDGQYLELYGAVMTLTPASPTAL